MNRSTYFNFIEEKLSQLATRIELRGRLNLLVPDNIHPEQTIYFNGAFVLKTIQEHRVMDMLDLYIQTKAEREMSMPVFVLCLDWLFLLNLITLNDHGKKVELCS